MQTKINQLTFLKTYNDTTYYFHQHDMNVVANDMLDNQILKIAKFGQARIVYTATLLKQY